MRPLRGEAMTWWLGSTPYSSMSNHIKERVTMIKVTVENFYSNFMMLEEVMREEGPKMKRLGHQLHAQRRQSFFVLREQDWSWNI
uniref:Uncharacterized protein n=1 Tax=Sciurus vulgaris TaxID=55149 RepID=A0A8D2ARJ3_SCIVU